MSITWLIIIWIIGAVVNIFTSEQIRDYKDYSSPKMFLAIGIFLSFAASWAMVYLNIVHEKFYIPAWIYHDCKCYEKISYEETWEKSDGEIISDDEYQIRKMIAEGRGESSIMADYIPHTHRIYTCSYCGHERKEQLQ